jgi:hypothetical protein
MAQTEHLPIYKAGYDVCLFLEQTVVKFARTHRYGLGAELREGARRVLRLVARANAAGQDARPPGCAASDPDAPPPPQHLRPLLPVP